MAKRKALGSGLEALLSTKQPAAGSQNPKEDYLVPSCSKISSIPIHEISRNKIDFVIVNGENAAAQGVGLTEEICKDFYNLSLIHI